MNHALEVSQKEEKDAAEHRDRLVVRYEKSGLRLVPPCLQRFRGECLLTLVIAHAYRNLPCLTFHSQCDALRCHRRLF
jgi:hypothetical protein